MRILTIPRNKINCVLRNYGISSNAKISCLQGGIENVNLLIKDKNKKYVFRVYQNKKTINEIESEIEVINYLSGKKIPVPIIYQDNNGGSYQEIDGTYGVLFSFVKGKHMPTKPIKGYLAKDIGLKLANMQKVLMDFKPVNERKFPYANEFREFKRKTKSIDNYILTKKKLIMDELEKVIITRLKKAIIHSDVTRENLLVTENELVSFLDFDDFHLDYLVWDTAIAITQLFVTKTFGIDWKGLKNFFKGYSKVLHLNKYEKEAVIPFLKLRNFKIAMQVNYMRNTERRNNKRLKSIEESVLEKINLIEENKEKIRRIIMHTG